MSVEDLKAFAKQVKGMLRVGEAAAFLGVTAETLRNWDKSGRLLAVRHPVTGYRYYEAKDLEHFLKQVVAQRAGSTRA
jgi:DNA-binding transcriptional MerR regulator